MKFERTHDIELVATIARHARIYPASSDDYSPPPHEWSPLQHESIWHILCWQNDELLGMFVCVPESAICWRFHVCLLPAAYGATSSEAMRQVTRWIFENTNCMRLVGSVPKYNTLACRLARLANWQQFGLNYKSYLKNGVLHDQLMFGISRSDLPCHS